MLNLSEEEWNKLFDKVDETIIKAQDDLPEPVREKAYQIGVIAEKYQWDTDQFKNMKVLGCYVASTNGPIAIFVGQVFEDCHQNIEETMQSVRQIYYHELAHAIGDLCEAEVKERGL